jgi:hypothetical protein
MNVIEQLANNYKKYYGLSNEVEAGLIEGMGVLEKRKIYLIQQCNEKKVWEAIGFTHDLDKAKAIANGTVDKIITIVDHIEASL